MKGKFLFISNLSYLRIRQAETQIMVNADRVQLHQLLLNLAINASDAMPNGGKLDIEITSVQLNEQPHALLRVSDTGIGMSPEIIRRVFDRRFTTKPDGNGLGLSRSADVVTHWGGRIDLESSPGRGSTFTVYLPLALKK